MPPIDAIDYTTPVGQVRLLIADVNIDDPLFADDQLEAFLSIATDNVKRAAARALDVIAVSEVLVSKKIRTQDLQTDGPAVAKALRDQAAALRTEADADDDTAASFFDVVPGPGTCSWPELAERPSHHLGWF